jgi:DNA-binding transcriptional ArsR family regulator
MSSVTLDREEQEAHEMSDRVEAPAADAVPRLAAMLKALGEPTRLRIFQFLRACCCEVALDEETGDARPVDGPTVGEVCCNVIGQERVTSTFSEHLKDLRVAGLILMERRGKSAVCAINPAALATLAAFFAEAPPHTSGDTQCCTAEGNAAGCGC